MTVTYHPAIPDIGDLDPAWSNGIRTTLRDLTAKGPFADRPAAGLSGRFYFATDQQLFYRDNGVTWTRIIGDPNEIWVTDYGAVPGTNSAPINAANTTAFNTAIAAARLSTSRNATVHVPMLSVGWTYYTDDALLFNLVTLEGRGNAHGGLGRTHGCAEIHNVTVGSGALRVDDTLTGTAAAVAVQSVVRNLWATGDEYGVYVKNRAMVTFEYFSAFCNVTGNTNNAAIVLENVFWVTFDHWSAGAGSAFPTHAWNRGPCSVLMIASEGGPIRGISQSSFTHGVMHFGGARFENRTTGASNNSECVSWVDVLTEDQGPQAFMQFDGSTATAPHVLIDWLFDGCERADALSVGAGTNQVTESTTAFYMVGAGPSSLLQLTQARIYGCRFYTYYLFQCGTQGDVNRTDIVGAPSSVTTFDAAHMPQNGGFAVTMRGGVSRGNRLRAQPNDYSNASVLVRGSGNGSGGFTIGLNNTDALDRWGVFAEGHQVYSDGTTATHRWDNKAAGNLALKALGANAASLDVDTSDATKDAAVRWFQNGSQKWKAYLPGSSTEMRWNNGADRLVLEAGGRLKTSPSSSGAAGLQLPHGAAPSAPADGDIWTTTAGLFVRINGVTKTATLT